MADTLGMYKPECDAQFLADTFPVAETTVSQARMRFQAVGMRRTTDHVLI
jgi:hypothetical protein